MSTKRKRQHDPLDVVNNEITPTTRKNETSPADKPHEDELIGAASQIGTPAKRRRGRPPGSTQKRKPVVNGTGRKKETASSVRTPKGKLLFTTPTKHRKKNGEGIEDDLSPSIRNAERSARRKSPRTLIQRKNVDELSDDNDLDGEDALARTIWGVDEVGNGDGQQDEITEDEEVEDPMLSTPSKGGLEARKKARRKRTPTPPPDLPPHELYFFQNRAANTKTSNNTFTQELLTHEQYHHQISNYEDPHASSLSFLHAIHSRSFPQWNFELSQSFSICLYGYGSKRHLVTSFAKYLHSLREHPKIVILNGYIPTLNIRQILTTVATVAFGTPSQTLGSQPREMIEKIIAHLGGSSPSSPIYIFINSLDAPPLRRAPIPSLLAQLASSPSIRLLATCDSPSFPLLWDTSLREQYNFLFHDTTTFISYANVEITSVVDDVNELLGRSGRSVKGKDGISFVLRSLPENARNLYRVLIAELLAGMDNAEEAGDTQENLDRGAEAGEHLDQSGDAATGTGTANANANAGIEYRVLYQKVVAEFICSSEMAFRTLLKEFHDHQMIESRRDGAGTEMLTVPFRRAEMELILEDLIGGE